MIFYFSGTGNSLYIAKTLAKINNENLISISSTMKVPKEYYEYTLKENALNVYLASTYVQLVLFSTVNLHRKKVDI